MRLTVTEGLVQGPTTAGSLISTDPESWSKTQLLVEQAPRRINMFITFQKLPLLTMAHGPIP